MTRTIRPYQPQDRATADLIFFRAVREGTALHLSATQRAAWAPTLTPEWDKPDHLLAQWCFVAEQDGRATGYFSMDNTGYLYEAFVIPEVMGDGTAAALYDTVMDRAKAAGLTRFTVSASPQSRQFLSRYGWQVESMAPYFRDGVEFTETRMFLNLDP